MAEATSPATGQLVGRAIERSELTARLDRARAGQSGALCLTGEAGVGKTMLLDHAAAAATGFMVLRAQGTPAESDLAFAGLSQLVRPARRQLADLRGPPGRALRGALGIGPPAGGDRFTTYVGLASLLGAAAEQRPLLVLVDDAHCWDAASADALVFACRRLDAEGVAVVVSTREPAGGTFAGLPGLPVGGLDLAATGELVAARAGRPVDPAVTRQLHEGTNGNPLALVELAGSLRGPQLTGREALDDPLPVGPALEREYRSLIARLPAGTGWALLLLAAQPGQPVLPGAAGLAGAGGQPDELEPAEAAGLIVIDQGAARFRHPVVRSACYHGATATARRAAHRLLGILDPDPDVKAWHLAAAAVGPDEQVALRLAETAARARVRNAHVEAARAFERAARLSGDRSRAAPRMLEAARELQLSGRLEAAVGLLDEAQRAAEDPLVEAQIHQLRARVDMWRGHPMRMHDLLTEQAARIEPTDPAAAAELYLEAVFPCVLGDNLRAGMAAARRAERLVGSDHPLVAHALAVFLTQQRREAEARPLLLRAAAHLAQADPIATQHLVSLTALGLGLHADYDHGRRLVGRLVNAARSRAMPGILPLALSMTSILEFWTGRWRESWSHAAESVRLAEATGQAADSSLAFGLFVEAGMGREQDTRSHAARAFESIARTGNTAVRCWLHAALGKLELGLGNDQAASFELAEAVRTLAPEAKPVPEWTADLAEAQLRVGRRPEAQELSDQLASWARANQHPVGQALAARTQLLLARPADAARWYRRAMAWFQRVDVPFERARTELYHGERLRRSRRLTESRTHLHHAFDLFGRLGAHPWAERARAELRASGAAVEEPERAARTDLTPQELQVALTVAGGATNREAAAQLLLSPKTVGFHLTNAYRKLGVRSRVELARRLSDQPGRRPITGEPAPAP